MADEKTQKNKGTAASREDRLKSALKANMARRKAQAKARAEKNSESDAGDSER